MFVVTNRKLDESADDLGVFLSRPNEQGPNELRIIQVTRAGRGFKCKILKDKLSKSRVIQLKQKYSLDIDENEDWYASLEAACQIFDTARSSKKNVLFFAHGYNNDVRDVMNTAFAIEKKYGVIVVPYSWPANGGGAVSGTLAYLSDKQDARASADAFSRFISLVRKYHHLLMAGRERALLIKARAMHSGDDHTQVNHMEVQATLTRLLDKECNVSINLMCHSMGNYLLKYALIPRDTGARELTFDNVSLVAADANNLDHAAWLERLQVRNRVYVVINEDDSALAWSRRKPGDEQLARLGHYLKNLEAENAYYLDVTSASWVRRSHSYFKGQPIERNEDLKAMFKALFTGNRAEQDMRFREDVGVYELR